MIRYHFMQFHVKKASTHASVQEAIAAAISDMDNERANPGKIEDDGRVIWENGGWGKENFAALRALAGEN